MNNTDLLYRYGTKETSELTGPTNESTSKDNTMKKTLYSNLETVGTVTGPDGTIYEVDWLCNWDEDGELDLNDRKDAVMLYDLNGHPVAEFCNPNWDEGGFRNVEHVLEMAAEFIRIGGLES